MDRLALRIAAIVRIAFVKVGAAHALTLLELQQIDLNHNGRIDPGLEQSIFYLHLQSPVYRAYDVAPADGRIESKEDAAMRAGANKMASLSDAELARQHALIEIKGVRDIKKLADQAPASSAGGASAGSIA